MRQMIVFLIIFFAHFIAAGGVWADSAPQLDTELPAPLTVMIGENLSYDLSSHFSDPDGDDLEFTLVEIVRNPISGKACGAADCFSSLSLSPEGLVTGLSNDETDEGDYAVIFSVADPAGGNTSVMNVLPIWLALSGEIQLSPDSHIFGPLGLGEAETHSFTIENISTHGSLILRRFSLNNAVHFSIINNTCLDRTLAPGATCSLDVEYRPLEGGTQITGMTVQSSDATDDGDYLEGVTLQGMAYAVEPNIELSRDSHDFGTIDVGSGSAVQVFTVFNLGNAPLTLSSLSVNGDDAAHFQVNSNTCGSGPIPASGSCAVGISFLPLSAGAKSASLGIDSNDPDKPAYTVFLSGNGKAPVVTPDPEIRISPADLNFGVITAGTTSSDKTVTITSAGEAALDIDRISISGADAASFAIEENTANGARLAKNQAAAVTLSFSPLRIGPHYASLRIPSNDPDTPMATVSLTGEGGASVKLYFPHIAATDQWDTEISLINTLTFRSISGRFMAYGNDGSLVSQEDGVTLPAGGRKEIHVDTFFSRADEIGYIVFETLDTGLAGYNKFHTRDAQRVAIPATSEIGSGDLYISHIASNAEWWTGISLVNTTSAARTLTLAFSNGESRSRSIPAGGHDAFPIAELFSGVPQPDINSAVIRNAAGIIGLELFGSHVGSASEYLSGILLKENTTADLYYPHIADNDLWWTGVVMYNPSGVEAEMVLKAYDMDGTELGVETLYLEGRGHKSDATGSLGLPAGTDWFHITADRPLTGFELFGKRNGSQLAGYTSVGIQRRNGVFAKLERAGWTGIAFVNTTGDPAAITLTARNDAGTVIAEEILDLRPHEKIVDVAEGLFSSSIIGATYIRFESDRDVVGFQLNGAENDLMLDALPGM